MVSVQNIFSVCVCGVSREKKNFCAWSFFCRKISTSNQLLRHPWYNNPILAATSTCGSVVCTSPEPHFLLEQCVYCSAVQLSNRSRHWQIIRKISVCDHQEMCTSPLLFISV